MEVLEDASDSTIKFIHLLGDTGSWLGAATWNKFFEHGGATPRVHDFLVEKNHGPFI